ncbi:MAG TPA: hypothetical protein VF783_22170, partial [Terriglobales bacterium]
MSEVVAIAQAIRLALFAVQRFWSPSVVRTLLQLHFDASGSPTAEVTKNPLMIDRIEMFRVLSSAERLQMSCSRSSVAHAFHYRSSRSTAI